MASIDLSVNDRKRDLIVKTFAKKGHYSFKVIPQLPIVQGVSHEPPGTVSGDVEVSTDPPSPDDPTANKK